MRLVTIFVAIGLAVAVLFSLYVRLAPSDPQVWHVDPRNVEDQGQDGAYLLRDGDPSDGPAPRFAGAPEEVMARLDAVAEATPGVTRLAGSPSDRHVTYVARSRLFGFPDYISVIAWPVSEGTAVAVYSRLRFGSYDLGVNRRRVLDWLEALA
ncbi:DUF1499 domain-containing protein [Mangrovicoccus algicola]|uniref:DUF1499 domain-containing protein n=1 Tax=Mangrovicoccus algicola TaxID=2771008 RepID=A0A8J7CYY9_9RHOB|nr:DUF1499 domain-containing protein [Mangrovicoccus algicola]MBE3637138.1 DUF1499 domain-containing protein [Mangrovicoccus algicola]